MIAKKLSRVVEQRNVGGRLGSFHAVPGAASMLVKADRFQVLVPTNVAHKCHLIVVSFLPIYAA